LNQYLKLSEKGQVFSKKISLSDNLGLKNRDMNDFFGIYFLQIIYLSTTMQSRNQKVLKVERKIMHCKRPILKCFQTCEKTFCRKMAGFHDKITIISFNAVCP
jgi:hypothetical protein